MSLPYMLANDQRELQSKSQPIDNLQGRSNTHIRPSRNLGYKEGLSQGGPILQRESDMFYFAKAISYSQLLIKYEEFGECGMSKNSCLNYSQRAFMQGTAIQICKLFILLPCPRVAALCRPGVPT